MCFFHVLQVIKSFPDLFDILYSIYYTSADEQREVRRKAVHKTQYSGHTEQWGWSLGRVISLSGSSMDRPGRRDSTCNIIPEPLGEFIIRLGHTPVALIQAESRVTGIPLEDCNGHKSMKNTNISLNEMLKKAPSFPSICLFVLKMKTRNLIIGKGLLIKYSLLRFTLL